MTNGLTLATWLELQGRFTESMLQERMKRVMDTPEGTRFVWVATPRYRMVVYLNQLAVAASLDKLMTYHIFDWNDHSAIFEPRTSEPELPDFAIPPTIDESPLYDIDVIAGKEPIYAVKRIDPDAVRNPVETQRGWEYFENLLGLRSGRTEGHPAVR